MTVLSLPARRVATVLSTAASTLALTVSGVALASPALAANSDGSGSGDGLSILQTLGIFAGIPLGMFLIVALLVYLPGWLKASRGTSNSTAVGPVGDLPTGGVRATNRRASDGPESFGIEPPSV